MQQNEKRTEHFHQYQEYAEWLLCELGKRGVKLSVTSENGLHIRGEITTAQKELIRIWKRQLIEALSPHCSNCNLAMDLMENGNTWFCPLGCESKKA